MILRNNLYSIQSEQITENGATYVVCLIADSIIYKAHFPGHPITPGVCILQIARELLEKTLNIQLEMTKVSNVKFLSVISPDTTDKVTYNLHKIIKLPNSSQIKMQADVRSGDTLFAKISMSCTEKKYE